MKDSNVSELWGMGTRETDCVCAQGGEGFVLHRPGHRTISQFTQKQLKHIVNCRNSYHKNCGDRAAECAESDLLGEALDALKAMVRTHGMHGSCENNSCDSCDLAYRNATASLAKRKCKNK